MKPNIKIVWFGVILAAALLLLSVQVVSADFQPTRGLRAAQSSADPVIMLTATMAPGVLGLPGETVVWTIALNNPGSADVTGVVVTDTLPDTLRIDSVNVVQGQVAVSDLTVVYTLPTLAAGQSVQIDILTTVLRGPENGVLLNRVMLTAQGSQGSISKNAAAEVFVPTGLPATGYPPSEELPGDGEPPVWMFGLAAVFTVSFGAVLVWLRGRRWQVRHWYLRQG
jgi:uncharacterized repeat protein (TIGR01451 family)